MKQATQLFRSSKIASILARVFGAAHGGQSCFYEIAARDCGRSSAEAAFRELRNTDGDSPPRSARLALRRIQIQILNNRLGRL